MNNRGILIVLSGFSGAGKGTIKIPVLFMAIRLFSFVVFIIHKFPKAGKEFY